MRTSGRWLVALAMLAAACSDGGVDPCAGKGGPAGTHAVAIESGGRERTFLVTAPDSALQGRPVPLVVVYHGVNGTAEVIQAVTAFPDKAAAEGFITVAGDGVGRSWNAGGCCQPAVSEGIDDVQFTRDMVAAVEADYCVDPGRVYATGFSNGAAMVFRLACETTDLFAAFAPVAGALAITPCTPAEPRPIDIVNNVSDPVVPFVLGQVSFNRFLDLDGCSSERDTSTPAATAACEIAPRCAGDAVTQFCAVEGTSHQWPGGATNPHGEFRATDAVWEFLSAAHR